MIKIFFFDNDNICANANIDNDEVNLDDMSVEQILTLIGDVSVTGEKNMCA